MWLHIVEQETGWFISATKEFQLCFLEKRSRTRALARRRLKLIRSFGLPDFRYWLRALLRFLIASLSSGVHHGTLRELDLGVVNFSNQYSELWSHYWRIIQGCTLNTNNHMAFRSKTREYTPLISNRTVAISPYIYCNNRCNSKSSS